MNLIDLIQNKCKVSLYIEAIIGKQKGKQCMDELS